MTQAYDDLAKYDALVSINGAEAWLAFKKWRDSWDRPDNKNSRHAPKEFSYTIARRLELKYEGQSTATGLPQSAAAWSRLKTSGLSHRLRRDVCWQILTLHGIDITSNKELSASSMNSTDLAILGVCSLLPVEDEGNNRQIMVRSLQLRSTEYVKVTRSDLTGLSKSGVVTETIGRVRYHLLDAYLSLDGCSDLDAKLLRIEPGEQTELGSAMSISIGRDDREIGKWQIEKPQKSDSLRGRFDNLVLGETCGAEEVIKVTVSASIADVLPELRIESKDLNHIDENNLRDRLVEQVMRVRMREGGSNERRVLSIAYLHQ